MGPETRKRSPSEYPISALETEVISKIIAPTECIIAAFDVFPTQDKALIGFRNVDRGQIGRLIQRALGRRAVEGGHIWIVDVRTGSVSNIIGAYPHGVSAISISPDGKLKLVIETRHNGAHRVEVSDALGDSVLAQFHAKESYLTVWEPPITWARSSDAVIFGSYIWVRDSGFSSCSIGGFVSRSFSGWLAIQADAIIASDWHLQTPPIEVCVLAPHLPESVEGFEASPTGRLLAVTQKFSDSDRDYIVSIYSSVDWSCIGSHRTAVSGWHWLTEDLLFGYGEVRSVPDFVRRHKIDTRSWYGAKKYFWSETQRFVLVGKRDTAEVTFFVIKLSTLQGA